jgi:hypothetical protein
MQQEEMSMDVARWSPLGNHRHFGATEDGR